MIASTTFRRTSPESQGIRTSAILAFVEAAERDIHDLHSLIVLRRGNVVAEGYWEPYGPAIPHLLFSLSKSFTSTAIGMLVAEGRLSVDDPVLGFFPNEAPPEPGQNLSAMRVRHLLTMTTGHTTEPARPAEERRGNWVRAFLAHPVEHAPGSHFLYNSMATYMLSAIAQHLTGERLVSYLQPRLFAPLGIDQPTWETSPQGIDAGGWGLSIRTADIARFGQLYLQRGVWGGKRLLSESWVVDATSRQVPNGPNTNPDWEQGYGYQFWRSRHGAYRGDGAFGQFCVVLPDQEAVIAITAGVSNMQAVLDLVWKQLLPALGPGNLPDNPNTRRALDDKLNGLRLAPAAGRPGSPRAAEFSGRSYQLADNHYELASLAFEFADEGGTLVVRGHGKEQRVPCGSGRWERSEGTLLPGRESGGGSIAPAKLAASAAWTDDQTYVVELCWYETPFRRTLTCHFADDAVLVDQKVNVAFGPTGLPRLEGHV